MFTQMGTSGNLPFAIFYFSITITSDITVPIRLMPYPYTSTTFILTLSLLYAFLLFTPSFLFRPFFSLFFHMSVLFLLYWEVSWCSWLSHHFYVVRVPGSNPGGTIFACYILLFSSFSLACPSRLPFSYRIIGRFISSRIHPFPSEHGSKDA